MFLFLALNRSKSRFDQFCTNAWQVRKSSVELGVRQARSGRNGDRRSGAGDCTGDGSRGGEPERRGEAIGDESGGGLDDANDDVDLDLGVCVDLDLLLLSSLVVFVVSAAPVPLLLLIIEFFRLGFGSVEEDDSFFDLCPSVPSPPEECSGNNNCRDDDVDVAVAVVFFPSSSSSSTLFPDNGTSLHGLRRGLEDKTAQVQGRQDEVGVFVEGEVQARRRRQDDRSVLDEFSA